MVIGKRLSMFGTAWICESTFPAVSFMKSNQIFLMEKLESKLRYAVCKIHIGFQRLAVTKRI